MNRLDELAATYEDARQRVVRNFRNLVVGALSPLTVLDLFVAEVETTPRYVLLTLGDGRRLMILYDQGLDLFDMELTNERGQVSGAIDGVQFTHLDRMVREITGLNES